MQKRRAWLFPLVAASLAVSSALGFGGGTQTAASASASSLRILFASNRGGAWALYSMAPAGSDQSRLAGDLGGIEPGAEGDGIGVPALTPDGSEVLVPLNGTTAIALATGARRPISVCAEQVVWSPDAKALACSGQRSFNAPIYVVAQPGGAKHVLPGTKEATPVAWSPDGNWILFSLQAGYGPDYLWRIHPDGTGRQRISTYTPSGSDVLWLPDGRAEFVGTRAADSTKFEKLIALDVNSGTADVLGKVPTPDAGSWSPDGTTLVFATTVSGPSTLYTVDVAGGALRRLSPHGKEQYDISPAWSPDGQSIAFVRQTDKGAARYASEIWTMNADGSNQHRLTRPYPDGGANAEPLWVNGPVHVTTTPQAQGTRHTLRVPYLVAGVTARRNRVAVAPYGYDSLAGADPTPPLLVWHPGSRTPESLVGSLCGTITPEFFTGDKLAISCDANFLDEHRQAVLDFDLRTRIPAVPVYAFNAFFGPGTQFGTVVDGPVLSGGRIEFETSRWIAPAKHQGPGFAKSKLPRQILWAAHGSHRTRLHFAHRLGSLVAGDKRWLAFTVNDGVEITSPSGRPVLLLRLPALHLSYRDPAADNLLAGNELIRFGGGTLEGWDVRNGQVLVDRSVPTKAQLDAADSQYIVYTVDADLHLISRTGERVIHTPATHASWNNYYNTPPLHPVYAALSSAGLFYSYDLKGGAFPGRVVFVPRSRLPR